MKKFFSLLKATSKGDLNVFKVKNVKNKFFKSCLFLFLSVTMMFVSYTYANLIGNPLGKIGLSYILLTLFSLAIVVLNVMETVYKSQGIIFDAKDNNLVFSLPVKKSYILTARIFKLLAFDYIFQILFLVPCFIKYIQLENPGVSFYFVSLLFFIVLPLIPLVIGCIIGYFIKAISSIFKNKKMIQTVISLIMFFAFYAFFMNLENGIGALTKHATSINDLIGKIYLPIGLYVELIQKFNIVKLAELIIISILPFILFIYIFQFKYAYIINNSKETGRKIKSKKYEMKSNTIISSLTRKEIKTYFSIPVYVFNTIIGPILAVLASVVVVLKFDSSKVQLLKEFGIKEAQFNRMIPLFVIVLIMGLVAMTSITSSAISLEGKKISLVKSLPINPYDLFLSKILTSDIIIIPFILVSALILIIKFKIFNYYIIFILLVCTLFPHLIGEIGLLVNLMFPRLDYNSEVEVVKQSMAVIISLMIGIIICFAIMFTFNYIVGFIGNFGSLCFYSFIIILLTYIVDKLLKTYGVKLYQQL